MSLLSVLRTTSREQLVLVVGGLLDIFIDSYALLYTQEGFFIHDIDSLTLTTNPKALNGSHLNKISCS